MLSSAAYPTLHSLELALWQTDMLWKKFQHLIKVLKDSPNLTSSAFVTDALLQDSATFPVYSEYRT